MTRWNGPSNLAHTTKSRFQSFQWLGVHWKDWCWSWNYTLATWCEEVTNLKRPDAGKDWGQAEKGITEDEMVGWHQWLNGHKFGWTLGVGDGQGGLACCSPWGRKESDTTEQLNWTEPSQGYLLRGRREFYSFVHIQPTIMRDKANLSKERIWYESMASTQMLLQIPIPISSVVGAVITFHVKSLFQN